MSQYNAAPPTKRSRVANASTGDCSPSDESEWDYDGASLRLGSDVHPSSETIDLQFEAFGSGVVLSRRNRVKLHANTVKRLRRFVAKYVCGVRTRSVRLFVGHGGTELANGRQLLADTPLAAQSGKPIVVFPKLCALQMRMPLLACRKMMHFLIPRVLVHSRGCCRAR